MAGVAVQVILVVAQRVLALVAALLAVVAVMEHQYHHLLVVTEALMAALPVSMVTTYACAVLRERQVEALFVLSGPVTPVASHRQTLGIYK